MPQRGKKSRSPSPVPHHSSPVTHYFSSPITHYLYFPHPSPLTTHYSLLTHHPSPITFLHPSPITCIFPTPHPLPLTTHHSLLTSHFLLITHYPSLVYCLLVASSLLHLRAQLCAPTSSPDYFTPSRLHNLLHASPFPHFFHASTNQQLNASTISCTLPHFPISSTPQRINNSTPPQSPKRFHDSPLTPYHLPLTTHYSLLTHHPLPITLRPSPITHYPSQKINLSPLTSHYSLFPNISLSLHLQDHSSAEGDNNFWGRPALTAGRRGM